MLDVAVITDPSFAAATKTTAPGQVVLMRTVGLAQARIEVCKLIPHRSTWHYALNDYQGQRRLMHRITIERISLR